VFVVVFVVVVHFWFDFPVVKCAQKNSTQGKAKSNNNNKFLLTYVGVCIVKQYPHSSNNTNSCSKFTVECVKFFAKIFGNAKWLSCRNK